MTKAVVITNRSLQCSYTQTTKKLGVIFFRRGRNMLVEPKPDMKDYMYLYRLVEFVISIAIFPRYACIHLIVCVSLLFLFHLFFGHTCIKLLNPNPLYRMLLHIIINFFIEKKMYVKGIQGHLMMKSETRVRN